MTATSATTGDNKPSVEASLVQTLEQAGARLLEAAKGAAPWGIVKLDDTGAIVSQSGSAADFIDRLGESTVRALLAEAEAAGGSLETTLADRDGKELGLSVVLRPYSDSSTTVAILREVAGPDTSHGSADERERLYLTALESACDCVFLTNDEGRLAFVGPKTGAMLGYTEREVRAMGSVFALLGDDLSDLIDEATDPGPSETERTVVGKSGERRRFLISVTRVELLGGTRLYTCRDITARWEAEQDLEQQKRTLQTILDGLPDIVSLQNPDHTVVAYNKAGYEALGLTPDQVTGRKCFELIGRQTPCAKCATRMALASGCPESVEKYVPELGFWILARSIPIADADGKVSMLVEQISNIQERRTMEDALREREELLNETGDMARVGGWEVDIGTGRVTWTNATASIHEMPVSFSPSLEEAIAFYAEEDRPDVMEAIRGAMEKGESFDRHWRLVSASGKERWVRAIGKPQWENGRCLRLRGTFQDVTEQRLTNERLEEATSIINRSTAVAFTWKNEPGWPVAFVSENVSTILGYSADELLAGEVAYSECIHPDDFERVAAEVATFLDQPDANEFVHKPYRLIAKDGSCRWVSDWTFAERDADASRRVTRLKGIVQDITERTVMERALRESEEKLRAVLDNVGIGIALIDPDMSVLSMNRQMREWYPAVDPEQKPICYRSFNDPPAEGPCNHCPTLRTLHDGEIHESLTRNSSGRRVRNFRIVSSPIKDASGRVVAAIEMVDDVTDRMAMEEELRKIHKLESVGTLAGGIAHDFNNLLGAILGNATLAAAELGEGHVVTGMLLEIERACDRATGLTHRLLTFAKGGAPVKHPLRIEAVVADAVDLALSGSNVRPRYDFEVKLPRVSADEAQLSQAIANLAINAREAMPSGGEVLVAVRRRQALPEDGLPLEPGPYVAVGISDSGVGIPAASLANVFDPFFTTKKAGSGLGLSVVYSVVRSHGGHVTVASEQGKGSTFVVFLPALPEPLPAFDASRTHESTAGARVLVMDDEEMMRDMIRGILDRQGYVVWTAADGDEALRLFAQARAEGTPPQLVILDLTIPGGMGGYETLMQLRRTDPHLPAIVSSGYSDDPAMSDFRAHGFTARLPKPFSLAELTQVVISALSGADEV